MPPDLEPASALAAIDVTPVDHPKPWSEIYALALLAESWIDETGQHDLRVMGRSLEEKFAAVRKLEADAREADRFRLQTVVDERIEIEPVLSADELITIVERTLGEWSRRIVEQDDRIASLEAQLALARKEALREVDAAAARLVIELYRMQEWDGTPVGAAVDALGAILRPPPAAQKEPHG